MLPLLRRSLCALALAVGVQPVLADPPGRVGRISIASGDVQFSNTHTGEREPAQINWPVTGRNVILTGADGLAEVQIGSTSIRVDRDSEVEFATLDDDLVRVRMIAGRMAVRVRSPGKAEELDLRLPHGRFIPAQVGLYRVETRGERDSSSVAVWSGAGHLDVAGRPTRIDAGRRVEVTGSAGSVDVRMADAARDAFDDWNFTLDGRASAPLATRYVSPEMTGYEALDGHGEWREEAGYGPIWVPHVAGLPPDWAPYRWGRWAWIDPWGWTWVDAAPWGFAPSHYGRWVHTGSAWGWAPGPIIARPVYAPALVGWIGGPGTSLTVRSGPGVGWFPLAPGEAFHPYYAYSPAYLQRVNRGVVPGSPRGPLPTAAETSPRWRHATLPQAVTMVPAGAMASRQPITPAVAAPASSRSLQGIPVAPAATMIPPPGPSIAPARRHAITVPGSSGPAMESPGRQVMPPTAVAPPAQMHLPAPAAAPRRNLPTPMAAPVQMPARPAPVPVPGPGPARTYAPVPSPMPGHVAPRIEPPRMHHPAPVHVSPPVVHVPRQAPHVAPPAVAPANRGQPHSGGGGHLQRRSRDGK